MEFASKLRHDPISLSQKSPIKVFPRLPILDLFTFLPILLLSLLESCLILMKYDLYFHIIPIICFLSILTLKLTQNSNEIYVVDFSCYRPPNHCRIPHSSFIEHMNILVDYFDKESVEFMSKILTSSGQGPETYLPTSLHYLPPRPTHENSIDEGEMVLFPIMEDLLLRCNVTPCDIDVLIVNCSGLCPSPSLTSIIVNKFKLRPNIKTFNLSGMGCSASMISLGLAQNLLKVHKECNVVILSTEILTMGWYQGNERPKLILNCLFRMGGAGIMLSNRKKAKNVSKYRLVYSSRAQWAFEDKAYKSAFREEDSKGFTGVTLKKDILDVASDMIRAQLTGLGSKMLPTLEKLKFVMSIVRKKYVNKSSEIYVPNFKTIIRHFCLPVSGRPVIREIGKGLRLGEKDMEAALSTLHRFGNQSSSSLWYELAYLEAKERVKKGENVWMLGMGSGPKCTSVVLECIRPIMKESKKGPWGNCIDRYPFSACDN
ncbi:3-ketoacyl-CoA synthase 5-like [Silene latifolia]|uniref:3-ketoacyl-CoA synthase 5-like n=1 Tax=Silene latifolia TaxID=37657 RepID=UPI003D788360